jgi:hypothetical protein
MSETFPRSKLSHQVVRIVVLINLAVLALDMPSSRFYRLLEQFHLNTVVVTWFIATSLILPLYVVIEVFWMKSAWPRENRSILLDAALVGIWFIAWWGAALYSLMHTVWI